MQIFDILRHFQTKPIYINFIKLPIMKRNILFLLSLCVLLLTCSHGNEPINEIEKPNVEANDPFMSLKKTNIDFTNEGGSEAILMES